MSRQKGENLEGWNDAEANGDFARFSQFHFAYFEATLKFIKWRMNLFRQVNPRQQVALHLLQWPSNPSTFFRKQHSEWLWTHKKHWIIDERDTSWRMCNAWTLRRFSCFYPFSKGSQLERRKIRKWKFVRKCETEKESSWTWTVSDVNMIKTSEELTLLSTIPSKISWKLSL